MLKNNALRRGQEEVGVVFNAQSRFLSHGFLLRIGNAIEGKNNNPVSAGLNVQYPALLLLSLGFIGTSLSPSERATIWYIGEPQF